MVISLTTTPMMCAYLLKDEKTVKHGRAYQLSERGFTWVHGAYSRSLTWVLKHPGPVLTLLLLTIALNFYLIVIIPKGFFPQQDTGAITGSVRGPQDASFPVMNNSILQIEKVIKADPAVDNVIAYTGGNGSSNGGFVYIALKPLDERKVGAPEIINRLRPKLNGFRLLRRFSRRRRTCASEGDRAMPCTNTQFSPTTWQICRTGDQSCLRECRSFKASRM